MNPRVSKKSTKKEVKSLTLEVFDIKGKGVEAIELDPKVFDGVVIPSLMHQAVTAYLANQRAGLATAKTRGKVRGGGTKPWRQKGTGRARVGSIRSPIWRGGGVTFGPQPRSYHKDLPKKMKASALKSALNAKLNSEQITVLKDLSLNSHKTKELVKVIGNLKLNGQKIKLVVEKIENNSKLACRNLDKVSLIRASDVCTAQVLDCKRVVVTKDALTTIQARVKKCL